MDKVINEIINSSESKERSRFETALSDLRHLIERYTMNRFSNEEQEDYFNTFYNKSLIDYQLNDEKLMLIKHFLFYALLNFPDRAVLVAKCIKVLFEESSREAICAGIEVYMKINDDATSELIFAITDLGDIQNYLSNERIFNLFIEISKFGGKHSKEAVNSQLNYYKRYYQ